LPYLLFLLSLTSQFPKPLVLTQPQLDVLHAQDLELYQTNALHAHQDFYYQTLSQDALPLAELDAGHALMLQSVSFAHQDMLYGPLPVFVLCSQLDALQELPPMPQQSTALQFGHTMPSTLAFQLFAMVQPLQQSELQLGIQSPIVLLVLPQLSQQTNYKLQLVDSLETTLLALNALLDFFFYQPHNKIAPQLVAQEPLLVSVFQPLNVSQSLPPLVP
jgi:hypothetical protein